MEECKKNSLLLPKFTLFLFVPSSFFFFFSLFCSLFFLIRISSSIMVILHNTILLGSSLPPLLPHQPSLPSLREPLLPLGSFLGMFISMYLFTLFFIAWLSMVVKRKIWFLMIFRQLYLVYISVHAIISVCMHGWIRFLYCSVNSVDWTGLDNICSWNLGNCVLFVWFHIHFSLVYACIWVYISSYVCIMYACAWFVY